MVRMGGGGGVKRGISDSLGWGGLGEGKVPDVMRVATVCICITPLCFSLGLSLRCTVLAVKDIEPN